MKKIIGNIEPNNVFGYFEDICNIPHVSYHTEKIQAYIEAFAIERGLAYHKDNYGNIVVFKEASEGYEEHEPVIIQGHTDMVGASREGYEHDFFEDPLILDEKAVEEGYIKAVGTTLGADDGIAVAYALAILSDTSLKHPRLEVVFTADEEVGMLGAAERLYAHYHWPEYVEIVDGGTQGLNLLGYVESASHLLILDAIDYGLEPGTLRTYAGERIPAYLSAKKMSLHQNSFSEVLALADIRGHLPAHIALVGLQPAMLDDYGGSLSALARAQLPAAEQAALAQLAAWGIVPQPANESRCLNYDCLSMENYEGVRLRQYRMTQEEQG